MRGQALPQPPTLDPPPSTPPSETRNPQRSTFNANTPPSLCHKLAMFPTRCNSSFRSLICTSARRDPAGSSANQGKRKGRLDPTWRAGGTCAEARRGPVEMKRLTPSPAIPFNPSADPADARIAPSGHAPTCRSIRSRAVWSHPKDTRSS